MEPVGLHSAGSSRHFCQWMPSAAGMFGSAKRRAQVGGPRRTAQSVTGRATLVRFFAVRIADLWRGRHAWCEEAQGPARVRRSIPGFTPMSDPGGCFGCTSPKRSQQDRTFPSHLTRKPLTRRVHQDSARSEFEYFSLERATDIAPLLKRLEATPARLPHWGRMLSRGLVVTYTNETQVRARSRSVLCHRDTACASWSESGGHPLQPTGRTRT